MDGALCKLWLRQQSGALTKGLVSRLRAQRKTCLQTPPLSVMTAPGGGGSASGLAGYSLRIAREGQDHESKTNDH